MDTASFRGRDYVFLDAQVSGILEQLNCPVCLQLPAEPVYTSCGHFFCRECIKGPPCPMCRCKEGFTISLDVKIKQVINKLRVKCEDCGWQGQLEDAKEHLGDECEPRFDCDFSCAKKMTLKMTSRMRYHVERHCQNESYEVIGCDHSVQDNRNASLHIPICPKMPLACPGKCRPCFGVTRRCMQRHLSNECPEEYVSCKYAMFGCDAVVRRREMSDHLASPYHAALKTSEALSTLVKFYLSPCDTMPDLGSLSLSFRPWLQNKPTCYPCPPWIVKVEGFDIALRQRPSDFFPPFDPVYSHFGGYKMCLDVHPADPEADAQGYEPDHIGVYVQLCVGDNDKFLKFPFIGNITVSLLNQEEDSNHWTINLLTPDSYWNKEDKDEYAFHRKHKTKVTEEDLEGCSHFISHNELGYNLKKNRAYLKNDTLFFRFDKIESVF